MAGHSLVKSDAGIWHPFVMALVNCLFSGFQLEKVLGSVRCDTIIRCGDSLSKISQRWLINFQYLLRNPGRWVCEIERAIFPV
jgi:hypothetical protein